MRVGDHGALALTDEGLRRAESRQRRCDFFESLLVRSGVAADTAAQEAQAVTHALSATSAEALKARLEAQ